MNISQYQKLIKISLPIVGTSMANVFANVIGMIFVAKLGHDQLAAGALASSTYIALLVIATGSMYSISILIAGADKSKQGAVRMILHSGVLVGLLLIMIVATVFYFVGDIFYLFHQPLASIAIATRYFHTMIFALPLIIVYMVLQQFFIGTERAGINLQVTIISLISTSILSYVFILGKFGLPTFGLQGLAIAQLISLTLVCGLYIIQLYRYGDQQKHQIISAKLHYDLAACQKILTIGLPIGVQYGAELAVTAIATYFMGWLGVQVLAASQISSQISMLAVMVFLGISQGAGVLVSRNMSENNIQQAIEYNRTANMTGFVLMLVVTAIIVSMPDFLIHFYVNVHDVQNQFVIHQAKILLAVSGLVLMVDAVRNITAGSLRGIHDSKTPMIWGVVCQWLIALPLAYILGFNLHLGAGGIRFGFVIGFGICAVILLARFRSKMKQRLVMQTQSS